MNSLAIRHSKNIDKACPSCHGLAKLWNTNGTVNGWHYYIQDYMGNNRMVVNKNGTVEQVSKEVSSSLAWSTAQTEITPMKASLR